MKELDFPLLSVAINVNEAGFADVTFQIKLPPLPLVKVISLGKLPINVKLILYPLGLVADTTKDTLEPTVTLIDDGALISIKHWIGLRSHC